MGVFRVASRQIWKTKKKLDIEIFRRPRERNIKEIRGKNQKSDENLWPVRMSTVC